MRVLGIDPGSLVTGYGVIDEIDRKLVHVASGQIRTRSDDALPLRLKVIYDGLTEVITRYQPGSGAVENMFHSQNVQSALKLGHARGVALLAVVNASISVAEYLPMEVKKSVAGSGHADKEQVRRMVEVLLHMKLEGRYDTSDALAVAICHHYSLRTQRQLERMEGGR